MAFLTVNNAIAADYYVDDNNTSASDTNPGTAASPWKTIYKAMAAPLQPGDTVHVRAGTYDASVGGTWTEAALRPSSSGAPGNPITFRAEPRNSVILDAKRARSTPAIGVNSQNYIVIDGFVVTNADGKGIAVFGRGGAVLGENCTGCRVQGIVLQNNIVHGIFNDGIAGDNVDGIRVENASGTIIRNNTIYDVDNTGPNWNAAAIKLYYTDNTLIENNEIYRSRSGIFDKLGGLNNTIRYNYIHDCGEGVHLTTNSANPNRGDQIYKNIINNCAISIGMMPNADGDVITDLSIYNNVFASYSDTGFYPLKVAVGTVRLWNNIFYKTSSSTRGELFTYSDPPANLSLVNYNLFAVAPRFYVGVYATNRVLDLATWRSETGFDVNSGVNGPAFQDPGLFNFKLSANSPAIGAGRVGGVGTGAQVNQGAYITGTEVIGPIDGGSGSGTTPPPSSGSGGDSGGGSSGGGGCGFVKDDGKGPRAKGEGLSMMILLIIILAGIALRRIVAELKMRRAFSALNKGLCFLIVMVLLTQIAACGGGGDVGEGGSQQPGGPVTLSYSPEGNAIGVPLSARVVVTASAPLDPSSVNTSTLYLVGSGGHVPSAITYSNNTATLTPSAPLKAGVSHTAVATTGIRNTSGAAVLAANHSWTFTTTAGDLPPLFARWESDMTTYGAQWGEFQNPNGPNGWAVRFDRAYYDVLNIMYQIKTYTGQSQPWDTYIGYAKYAYRNEYYRPNDYRVPGYRRFAHGLLADYLAGGDTTIDDIRNIRDIPAFSNLSEYNGAYAGSHQVMSREMAYALEAHIAAEKTGEPRQAQVSQFVTWMENHLHEWKSGQFAAEAWFQPFMFGISAQALIEFHEWEVANNRDPNASWPKTHWPTIPAALSDFSDWMYNTAVVRDGPDVGQRMWAGNYQNSGYGGFRYMDRNNTSISAEGSSVTPDLNALIAPVYAWVYKQTGSAAHRAMSDEVFAGGVYYSGASWGGKQFNQSYRWSFNYIKWRQEGQAKWGN